MQIDERTRDGKTKTRTLHAIVQSSIQLFEGRPALPAVRVDSYSGIFHIDVQSALEPSARGR